MRAALDEIFGEKNLTANIVWQKKYTRANDHNNFRPITTTFWFAKSRETADLGRVERGESQIVRMVTQTNIEKEFEKQRRYMPGVGPTPVRILC